MIPSNQLSSIIEDMHWLDLQKSGLSLEIIQKAGIYSASLNELEFKLGFHPTGVTSALAFPYEKEGYIRYKVFPPLVKREGKPAKYLQPKKTKHRLYMPFWHVEMALHEDPIYITEGEKKCLKAIQEGLVCVGLSGIWNFGDSEEGQLIPDFDALGLEDRTVFLVPDSDFMTNPSVMMAVHRLGCELERRKAKIRIVRLPHNGDEKVGLDDYLLIHSTDDLKALITISLDDPVFLGNSGFLALVNTQDLPADPKNAIRAAVVTPNISSFDRPRMVSKILYLTLLKMGDFFRTSEGRCFYFERKEKRLYGMESEAFGQLVTERSGLSPTENHFKFAVRLLFAFTARRAQLVKVRSLSSYDVDQNILAVSDGTTGIWRCKNGEWKLLDNGDEGLMFLTEPDAERWEPDFSGDGSDIQWFIDSFNFAGNSQEVEDQKELLKMWLLSLFFGSMLSTKVVPAFLGPQGSGKSTCGRMIGRLFLGSAFNVSGLRTDKEDAFVASLTNRVFHVIDNADSRVKWLEDALARYATGETVRLRALYTTNEEVAYSPRATLMLTSRDPHFRRPDVAERLLPFNMKRLEGFIDEFTLFSSLYSKRAKIMGDLLKLAQEAMEAIQTVPAERLRFRMADFAGFGMRISKKIGQEKKWQLILERLEKVQVDFASQEESIIEVLRFLGKNIIDIRLSTGDLYQRCSKANEQLKLLFPRSAQSFGRRFWDRQRIIETELGVKILKETGQGGVVFVTIRRDHGSDGPSPTVKEEREVTENTDPF
jgi:hypothetical protein